MSAPIPVVLVAASLHLVGVRPALEAEGDITVVASGNASEAAGLVHRHRPGVVVVELSGDAGAGVDAVQRVMAECPVPILVVAASADSEVAVRALMAGALEVFSTAPWEGEVADALRRRVRLLRGVTVVRHQRADTKRFTARPAGGTPVVAVAASTGGPAALAVLLGGLSGLEAPVLVVQHIHTNFVASFAAWMARVSALPVAVAAGGEQAEPGRVYVAPGGVHLRLGADGRLVLDPLPRRLHRPSADELFSSVAAAAGAAGVGVILTGMGDDGVAGLTALRAAGGRTIAQDEASSAVYGMPRAAVLRGAAQEVLALDAIAPALVHAAIGRR